MSLTWCRDIVRRPKLEVTIGIDLRRFGFYVDFAFGFALHILWFWITFENWSEFDEEIARKIAESVTWHGKENV